MPGRHCNSLFMEHENCYNPRQKSLARLNQIAWKCVDKLFCKHISNDITGIATPLPPQTMLETSSDEFITINNIEWGVRGWTDTFPRQMLQKVGKRAKTFVGDCSLLQPPSKMLGRFILSTPLPYSLLRYARKRLQSHHIAYQECSLIL